MAVWVTKSSLAAFVKLRCRAAASKDRSALSGGRSRASPGMGDMMHEKISCTHRKIFVRGSARERVLDGFMKLYRFRYSPYARKVQMLLDLIGARYELVEVPYGDRNEIARVTGGYIYVPVLVGD